MVLFLFLLFLSGKQLLLAQEIDPDLDEDFDESTFEDEMYQGLINLDEIYFDEDLLPDSLVEIFRPNYTFEELDAMWEKEIWLKDFEYFTEDEIGYSGLDDPDAEASQKTMSRQDSLLAFGSSKFLQGIGLYFHVSRLAGLVNNEHQSLEGGINLLIKRRLILLLEGGDVRLTPSNAYPNGNYISEGMYGRLGLGYFYRKDDKNNLYLTANYGYALFEDRGSIRVLSPTGLFEPYVESFSRDVRPAQWVELAFGTESRFRIKLLNLRLYYGGIVRVRYLLDRENHPQFPVFQVPGAGRADFNFSPSLDLYLKYHFDLR